MHPYTRGLLNSVPTLRSDRAKPLQTIEGTVPAVSAMPTGCTFEPRCASALPACAEALPPLVEVAAGHFARCPVQRGRSAESVRLLLLSDVHANLEALEACLAAAPAYDSVANLGDVVGYNASPNEVCERIREMNCPVVRGNHDRACSGLSNLSEFNLVAAMSARWTQMTLEPEHRDWLRNLPEGPAAPRGTARASSLCTARRAMKTSTC